jgi:peptide/nickel transport system permease protein
MVLVDTDLRTHPDTDAGAPPAPATSVGLVRAAARLALATVFVLLGTMLLRDAAMWLRVASTCLGVVLTYQAVRAVVHLLIGRPVDIALGLAVTWVGTLLLAAVLVPILPLAEASNSYATLDVPTLLRPDLFSGHPLGTNSLGLDMLSRVLWGARQSLTTAFLAIVLSTILGGFFGLIAGSWGGWVDRVTQIGTNVGLAFPPLVLLLVLGAVVGHSVFGVAFALGILSVAGRVRIARIETMRFASREHTYVARILGATRWQVLRREVLPPVAMSLVSYGFLIAPFLIVAEAALGYLGLGVRPPTPTWGNMLAEAGNGGVEATPHIVLVPGAVLIGTVFALNLIGQRLRAKWEG